MRALLAVLGKELKESFRDGSVPLYSIAFPLVLYPLLLWGTVQLLVLQAGVVEPPPPRLAVDAPLDVMEARWRRPPSPAEGGREALLAGEVDGVIAEDEDGTLTPLWRSTRARSECARALVEERVEAVRAERAVTLAVEVGLPPDALSPWDVRSTDTAGTAQVALEALSRVVPLVVGQPWAREPPLAALVAMALVAVGAVAGMVVTRRRSPGSPTPSPS
ncbi:MAG: hypothetical protein ABIO70_25570 [Pseudomonadota bacterium]